MDRPEDRLDAAVWDGGYEKGWEEAKNIYLTQLLKEDLEKDSFVDDVADLIYRMINMWVTGNAKAHISTVDAYFRKYFKKEEDRQLFEDIFENWDD